MQTACVFDKLQTEKGLSELSRLVKKQYREKHNESLTTTMMDMVCISIKISVMRFAGQSLAAGRRRVRS